MAKTLLKEAIHRIHDIPIQQGIKALSAYPNQLPLRGERSLMIFQPHTIQTTSDLLSCEATRLLINAQTEQFVQDGNRVVFFLEDASKKAVSGRKSREKFLRQGGDRVNKAVETMIANRSSSGDATDMYHAEQLNTFREQTGKHQGKDPNRPAVLMLFESAPKTMSPGIQTFRQADPWQFPLDTAFRRVTQLMAYGATRDIACAAQLIREAEKYPDSAFITMRGTAHAGLGSCIEEMAQMAYTQYAGKFADVDKPKKIAVDEAVTAFPLPVTWQRTFWRQIFERNPHLLKLPVTWTPGKDMESTLRTIRAILDEGPWRDYLHCALEQISHLPQIAGIEIVLRQGMF